MREQEGNDEQRTNTKQHHYRHKGHPEDEGHHDRRGVQGHVFDGIKVGSPLTRGIPFGGRSPYLKLFSRTILKK